MTRATVVLAFVSGVAALSAQAPAAPTVPLAFEVASIKPVETTNFYRFTFPRGGGFRATVPLEWLIGIAYEVIPFDRIVREPSWARTQFYDIEAKVSRPVSREENLAMLRTLIEDRFGLVWWKDPSGKAEVYVLRMAREDGTFGPGMRRTEVECVKGAHSGVSGRQLQAGMPVPCGTAAANGVYAGGSVSVRLIASTIQLALGEEVIDRTGLTGNFDYYVTLPRNGQDIAKQDVGDVSIFTAVQEQLGMKLEREQIARDVFIVERVSQPTPN